MKNFITSIRMTILTAIIYGILYPCAMTGFAKAVFPYQASGSLIQNSNGTVLGSELIAQGFKDPKYFWPRPSSGNYDARSSGGTNLGPISADLLAQVRDREKQGFTHEMLFSSGSGLDPHISPEAAFDQASRVAHMRGISEDSIRTLIDDHTESRTFGFMGEPRVNVLKLNLALDREISK